MAEIKNPECYHGGKLHPWDLPGSDFQKCYDAGKKYTLVSKDRCYILYSLLSQAIWAAEGNVYECGVFKGGTAIILAYILSRTVWPFKLDTKLRLFDTFGGMPEVNPLKDSHKKGDFSECSEEIVKALLQPYNDSNNITIHKGFIPHTFKDIGYEKIAFAHIDVDIYQSVWDCCDHIFPRMQKGGVMVFDDYGFISCPGARDAVDTYITHFGGIKVPLVLPTGQAVIYF